MVKIASGACWRISSQRSWATVTTAIRELGERVRVRSRNARTGAGGTNDATRAEQEERERHVYLVGKSGSGKSTALFNLAMHDIYAGEGVAVLVSQQPDLLMVGEASTGREDLEQFRTTRPDVTLMDLQMPDKNGIEAIAAICGSIS